MSNTDTLETISTIRDLLTAALVAIENSGGGQIIGNSEELDKLPNRTVVQFRNSAYVWQRDGLWWYTTGEGNPELSEGFRRDTFPAVVLWNPEQNG